MLLAYFLSLDSSVSMSIDVVEWQRSNLFIIIKWGEEGDVVKQPSINYRGIHFLYGEKKIFWMLEKRKKKLGRFIITRSPDSDGSSYDIDRLNGCHMIIYLIFSCVLEKWGV